MCTDGHKHTLDQTALLPLLLRPPIPSRGLQRSVEAFSVISFKIQLNTLKGLKSFLDGLDVVAAVVQDFLKRDTCCLRNGWEEMERRLFSELTKKQQLIAEQLRAESANFLWMMK